MEQNHVPITEFDMTLIADFFGRLPRQGPGSDDATRLALRHIGSLPGGARIADIGCGTGRQTFTLARSTDAQITAVDILPEFVAQLNEHARQEGIADRVAAVEASMEALPFAPESFDLLWSEGAITHIGFERGMREWNRFLRPGGHIAVSEFTWLTPERPAAVDQYAADNGIAPGTIEENILHMDRAGYLPQAHFVLPANCWKTEYYKPMDGVIETFLDDRGRNPAATLFVERLREEAALYDRYNDYYGYVFYIGRKR